MILNFIHKELKHVAERIVPVLNPTTDNPNVEIYHRTKFQGVALDVCVYWSGRDEGGFKKCEAIVKLASNDLSQEHAEDAIISSNAAWNAQAKIDSFTLKNDAMDMNYWAPRWKACQSVLIFSTFPPLQSSPLFQLLRLQSQSFTIGTCFGERYHSADLL